MSKTTQPHVPGGMGAQWSLGCTSPQSAGLGHKVPPTPPAGPLHVPDGTFLFTSPALTQTLQLPPASSLLSPALHPPPHETHDHPNSKIYPQFQ